MSCIAIINQASLARPLQACAAFTCRQKVIVLLLRRQVGRIRVSSKAIIESENFHQICLHPPMN